MSQRRTVFADILSSKPKEADTEQLEAGTAQSKKAKLNKAINPDYTKLTAYIPRDLHFEIKTAMAADQETDQSAYIERWLREMLEQRQSATGSKGPRVTA